MVKKIKVLHVLSNFGVGGAEVWLIALLRYFREAAAALPVIVETDIFLTNGVASILDVEARKLGANLIYSRYSRTTLPRFISDWRKCLSEGKYDAIHDHQEFTAGWHFLMGFGYLPKVRIAHLHNPMSHQKSYAESYLRKITLHFGNRMIGSLATHCLSTSLQLIEEQGFNTATFRNLHKEAVYCGFNTERFQGDPVECHQSICDELSLPLDAKIMLFVGRLDSHDNESLNQKNPVFCLDVAKRCAENDRNFYCLIAGSGQQIRAKLESRVHEWGLSNQIRFIGHRTDIPRLMLASRVLLLPSLSEGLGMVAVEAQAASLHVIASDAVPRECAVVDDLVDFMPLSVGPDRWAAAVMSKMYGTRADTQKSNSIIAASPFSIQNSAQRLLNIYCGKSYKFRN